jgi:hypothetical protein
MLRRHGLCCIWGVWGHRRSHRMLICHQCSELWWRRVTLFGLLPVLTLLLALLWKAG